MSSMTDEDLMDALLGLYAYDTGCVDSGIHDERLKQKCREEMDKDLRPSQLFSDRMARLVRDNMLDEDSIKQGYGLEDVLKFLQWIDGGMSRM